MDQRRMDAEGSRVVHRGRRAGKLALVVAVQNVLVVVCLLVTVYVYWDFHKWTPSKEIHIQFDAVSAPPQNTTIQFLEVSSSYMMDVNEKKNKINIKCTGPYIWHMEVCCKSLEDTKTRGMLHLQVEGNETPVRSEELQASTSKEVCRGLHSLAYLRAREVVSLRFNATKEFKLKTVTMGLHYLLGKMCEF